MRPTSPRKITTLVLAPTRELAAQIGESFSAYGSFLKFRHVVIFGGVSQGRQVQELDKGVDIVVATPGRLLDLLNQQKLTLKYVRFFVLDEADRMLDMGFIHDIKKIIAQLPLNKQTLFFSATMSSEVSKLTKGLLKNPVRVAVTPQATPVERINQCVYFVDQHHKEKLLLELLSHKHLHSVLIFTRTKHKANKVAQFLNKNKVYAEAIHGNKSQSSRTRAFNHFKSGKIGVLVATDIAARGIDIKTISHVINFELPNEPETYVHRIGRTARAGSKGTAYSLCSAAEKSYLKAIERVIKQEIKVMEHEYHSDEAQNAVGAASRPPPRPQRKGSPRGKRSRKPQKKFKFRKR